MVSDPFDVVREHYRAVNRADVEAVLALYHPDCVTERIVLDDEAGATCRGRAGHRARFAKFFGETEGALDVGAYFQVRSVAGIETGWGWAHAEWVAAFRPRAGGEALGFIGYSHFLVEDGLIRRHRSVASRATVDELRATAAYPSSPRAYPSRPIVGVGAVVFVDGRVVLIRRRYEPLAGQWSLPGGTVELGETLESAVAREVREETGLIVEVGVAVETFDRILVDDARRVRFHFVLIDYLCRPVGGQLAHGSDVTDVGLADPADLERYGLTTKAAEVIGKALRMVDGRT
jgi:ADP-ribose pyrophosphatase YjhB (NUDIX family)/ketosteroid isomerase-like protein